MPKRWRRAAEDPARAVTVLERRGADALLRPMVRDDVEQVVAVARDAYTEQDSEFLKAHGVTPWTEDKSARTPGRHVGPKRLLRHLVTTDPGSCWVVEADGKVAAALLLADREDMAVVGLFAVAPQRQGQGLATLLYEQVRDTVDRSPRAMAVASNDPDSVRGLFAWGFDVHPTMRAEGVVDRTRLPAPSSKVRDGTEADLELCVAIDRRMRGASRGADHPLLFEHSRLVVAEDGADRGYVYVRPSGSPYTLAATRTSLARALLTEALAGGPPGAVAMIGNLTSEQRWAFDVARTAGLDLHGTGPVLVRGMALPSPYLAHDVLC